MAMAAASAVGANRFGRPATEAAPGMPADPFAPAPAAAGFAGPATPIAAYPGAPAHAQANGAMLSGRALALVAVAIGIGIVGMTVSWALGQNERLEPATYLRYAIVITLGVYVLVGGLIVTRLVPGISLRWHHGRPAQSIVVGALVGGALGGGMLWISSTAAGHLSSDARIVTLMSEGDVAHIVVSIGIAVLCAPLIEETLFRGLLLESLRARSAALGLFASAGSFALWHLNIAVIPLVYYSLMGLMLGTLYLKRGLAGSMAGHAAFNGVLTVAALAIVLSPATTVTSGDVSLSAPGGWRAHTHATPGLVLEGPSEAALLVLEQPTIVAPTTGLILDRIRAGLMSTAGIDLQADTQSARETQLPAGPAVTVDITADGHAGTVVYVPRPTEMVEVIFLSGGSMKAKSDFPRMLDSLRFT
jgi:membrane protease YdiL (CAAX protease family)